MWTLSFGELLLLQIKLWSQGEGGEHSCAQTEDSPHLQLSSVMYQKEKKKSFPFDDQATELGGGLEEECVFESVFKVLMMFFLLNVRLSRVGALQG